MEREIFIYIDIAGQSNFVGRLWARIQSGHQSSSFEYDRSWLANPNNFALEPALTLNPGPFHTSTHKTLFGAFGDSAPDRWGRTLLRRAEQRRAEKAGEKPRTLTEIDYLLMVNDFTREGALRFADKKGGAFQAENSHAKIPILLNLPALLSASNHLLQEKENDEDLRLLLAPGSSLGGARPKASILDRDAQLAIAKFPRPDDEIQATKWEALALTLAQKAGIQVPEWRLESIGKSSVLISRRFDRQGKNRIPFLSAMSMLGANDNETHSYLEIADALRQYGAAAEVDCANLWRRMIFNILISNTDDHLRNHAFLYLGSTGWRLSPAYDLNPVPITIKPRILSTAIDFDNTSASLSTALEVADYFGLNQTVALKIAGEVGRAVKSWQEQAKKLEIPASEIRLMSSAFEHEDLQNALQN